MDEEKFNITFILIQPYVQKKDTVMREDIFAEERLITALDYLAIGKLWKLEIFLCHIGIAIATNNFSAQRLVS